MRSIVEIEKDKIKKDFPQDFLWGVAISAKQAEGIQNRAITVADLQDYNPNDKTKVKGDLTQKEIMDRLKNPNKYIFPKKIGINFYNNYKKDIALLSEMKIKTFRMSISWARIFPDGIDEEVSEEGLMYYDRVFDELLKRNIVPIVTLYHDDMPVETALKYNGFSDKKVVDSFVNYAVLVMSRYKEKVKYWIPVNQINLIRVGLSSLGVIKDNVINLENAKYQGVHNKFIACALIVEKGKKINPNFQFGSMLADFLVDPHTCKPEDIALATEKNQMTMYFYSDVQLRGEYPNYALTYFKVNNINIETNREEMNLLKNNPLDFLAISYYNSNVVSAEKNSVSIGDSIMNPYLTANEWGWTVNPLGLYVGLVKYWDRYQKPLMIAENGFGHVEVLDTENKIHDDYRIQYLGDHINAIRKAICKGVNVFAYCAWSPIDMVSSGTSEMKKRYGFIYNDLNDFGEGSNIRFKKDSFYWYKKVIESNGKDLD